MSNTQRVEPTRQVAGQPLLLSSQPAYTLHDVLVSELSRRGAQAQAALFAEPVENHGSETGEIDWYAPSGTDSARSWTALSDFERSNARSALERTVSEIRSLADGSDRAFDQLLHAALQVPSQDDVVFLDGAPLLIRWGMVPSGGPTAISIVDQILADNAQVPPTPVMGANAQRTEGSALLASLAVTTLLLSASALLTIRNCGLALPSFLTGGKVVYLANFCDPAASVYDLDTELLTRIEREVAASISQCQPGDLQEQTGGGGGVSQETIREREEEQGVRTGRLAVTLAWNGTADLDLHVICPSGERIGPGQQFACGGKLQLDMNYKENMSDAPIENVFWPAEKLPSGTFRVHVACFNSREVCEAGVPYTVEIKDETSQRIASFEGSAAERILRNPTDDDLTFAGEFEVP